MNIFKLLFYVFIYLFITVIFIYFFLHANIGKNGDATYAAKAAFATWDPRKSQGHTYDVHYDEIPYGDGPGPRGPMPDVPQHYAQVPPVPQRQGA